MNLFVHRMLGHYLMDEIDEDGAPGAGAEEVEQEEEQQEEVEDSEEPEEEPLEGEMVVSIGDEPEPESEEDREAKAAPKWVKELRKDAKEKAKRIRELEQKLQEREQQAHKDPEIELGKKPTLEDFDYDTDKFEAEYESWLERKRQIEAQKEAAKRQQEEAQAAWQSKLEAYAAQKEALKVRDYDDAEFAIKEKLNDAQRSILVAGLDNPALMVYALGKNEKELARLAAIKDPVRFAVEIGKLETQVKAKPRAEKPAPEKRPSAGTGSLAASTDRTLDQLRAEAEKTGDMTKVIQYKRQQRMKQG